MLHFSLIRLKLNQLQYKSGTLMINPEIIEQLKAIVGPSGWIEDDSEKASYLIDERDLYHGASPLVLRPASTEQLSEVIKLTSIAGVAIVPQGGNTGYCGGSIPDASGSQLIISLSRMNRIREVDTLNSTITVEAGCILANIQQTAEDNGVLFPLSLAAEGTCQIGGNLSTNAGGIAVLKYGNARDLVLGLEIVLPNGDIIEGLKSLRKDNTGYDLKHIFMGAEGTLGIITAAVLKLFPRPAETLTALIAVHDADAAIRLLDRFREASGNSASAFEYLDRNSIELVLEHIDGVRNPFRQLHDQMVLAEFVSSRADGKLQEMLEEVVGAALEVGDVLDAVVASNDTQAADIWKIRESVPEAQKKAGGSIKHDISIPLSLIPDFIIKAGAYVSQAIPGVRLTCFGHVGDGNLHFNLSPPRDGNISAFLKRGPEINETVHQIAVDMGGSFSAEHGIGQLKRPELEHYKSDVELELMRKIKTAIDPNGLMNPGKIVDPV